MQNIIDCYDRTAENYADQFFNELQHKRLDRMLLAEFGRSHKGPVADFGCGPGQTTRFLRDCGVKNITGIDISPRMVALARQLNPDIRFEQGDMLDLPYADEFFQSALAFYSIVHFESYQLELAFSNIYRVLVPGGEFLFSFHIGTEAVHREELLGHQVNVDFYFHMPEKIIAIAENLQFKVLDVIERNPYPDVEFPSRRAYIWLRKLNMH